MQQHIQQIRALRIANCLLVMILVSAYSVAGQQKPLETNTNQKQSASAPTSETKSEAKPLSKELSDKLLQYAALQAEKQKELNESKPARELALINDALEVLVSDALRTLGLDSKKYALKKNPQTGLLEAVPLAVPVPEPPR